MDLYALNFSVGKKVGVGIPLPDAYVFRDWAIIHDINEDLVTLQLSRDMLPVGVSLKNGVILELRSGDEENGYCCRAIIVSEGAEKRLLLRLIGEIVSNELREFYRVDAYLPIKYFVSREQNSDRLRREWEERRVRRQKLISAQKEQRWEVQYLQESDSLEVTGVDDQHHGLNPSEEEHSDGSWDSIIPLAANISGGGLRIFTHQSFEKGEYVLLEIFVPSLERVVDVVGRVVFANQNFAAGNDYEYFNTGVKFVYLDESDRDAIVNYISTIQLKRIRQLRETYMYRSLPEDEGLFDASKEPLLVRSVTRNLLIVLFLAIISLMSSYFWYYTHEHPKGEIQRIFEESVRKYKGQQ
ncbi:MAG: PilZ-like domain-containing protein [Desulfuromonadaceae bacterium]